MQIAVEGCGHGELDRIYDTVRLLQQREGKKIDLLICCGDFQAREQRASAKAAAAEPLPSRPLSSPTELKRAAQRCCNS